MAQILSMTKFVRWGTGDYRSPYVFFAKIYGYCVGQGLAPAAKPSPVGEGGSRRLTYEVLIMAFLGLSKKRAKEVENLGSAPQGTLAENCWCLAQILSMTKLLRWDTATKGRRLKKKTRSLSASSFDFVR